MKVPRAMLTANGTKHHTRLPQTMSTVNW